MTLVAACRDVLRVVSAAEGTDYDDDLAPVIEEAGGLSRQGLEQAARTYGFLRSLNLTGAPVHALVDCVAVNAFR